MAKILIIDDDEMMCERFSILIDSLGHASDCAHTLELGLKKSVTEDFDIVLLDVYLPDGYGIDAVAQVKKSPSKPEVIIVTASGDPDAAEVAIKSGAWDYIEKSPRERGMLLPLKRALAYREEKKSHKVPVALKYDGIVGKSQAMRDCMNLLALAATCDINVLITGDTGTGKELMARAIHSNSQRAESNFVIVDCTVLPEKLIESVLFGHEKGAFTGADKAQAGLIEQANGGTLFLDEIGELPLPTQKAFLRVLQERRFRRIGAKEETKSHFRLVAATHRNLEKMVEDGLFRKDLLYRLRSMTIELPPLRERCEDIGELARYHVVRLCERYGLDTKGFAPEFFQALEAYSWPGNIRELVNALDNALAVSGNDPKLYHTHLPTNIRVHMARNAICKGKGRKSIIKECKPLNGNFPKFKEFRQSVEKKYLEDLIAQSRSNVKIACQASGISRSRLYELLAKYDLSFSTPPSHLEQ
jgi:two-component system NtrC family response regulator